MSTRMQPIGNVWTKFPRMVRDLARLGKQVRVEMVGRRPSSIAPSSKPSRIR